MAPYREAGQLPESRGAAAGRATLGDRLRARWLSFRQGRNALRFADEIDRKTARAIGRGARFADLATLSLGARPSREVCDLLFGRPQYRVLLRLSIGHGPEVSSASDADYLVEALTACAMPALRELELNGCRIGDRGAVGLAAQSHSGVLEKLVLRANDIGSMGTAALVQGPWTDSLTELNLGANSPGPEGLGQLHRLPKLRVLSLHDCTIGDSEAKALAAHPFPSLVDLNLGKTRLGPRGASALAAAAASFPVLQSLHLYDCPLEESGRETLRRAGWLEETRQQQYRTRAGQITGAQVDQVLASFRATRKR